MVGRKKNSTTASATPSTLPIATTAFITLSPNFSESHRSNFDSLSASSSSRPAFSAESVSAFRPSRIVSIIANTPRRNGFFKIGYFSRSEGAVMSSVVIFPASSQKAAVFFFCLRSTTCTRPVTDGIFVVLESSGFISSFFIVGIVMITVVPMPSWLSMSSEPECSSMISFATARPMPLPRTFWFAL